MSQKKNYLPFAYILADAPFRWEEPDRLIQKRDVEEAEERAQREKRSEATARCTTCDFSVGRGVSAIDFSQGVEAGFEVPAEVSVNITGNNNNQNFTIELWLRSNNIFYPNRPQYILSRQPSYGVNDTISDFLTDFAVQLQPNGNLNVFMGGTFRNGFSVDCGFDHFRDTVWHHLAVVVFAPTTEFPIPQVILYVDAEEVCTFGPASRFFGTRNNLNTEPFLFSQYLTNASGVPTIQTWDGEMDEIRIWNNVRTVDQIKATYLYPLNGNEKGLVAYYTFDETPAGGPEDVWDSGPYEFIGALIGILLLSFSLSSVYLYLNIIFPLFFALSLFFAYLYLSCISRFSSLFLFYLSFSLALCLLFNNPFF